MKKVLLFLVAIIFIAGIGYAGYLIFNSKNIVKIEIEGTAQTLYLVDEAVSPDFQDAKLKITYKSGDVKYVEMKNSYLTIHDFSTSIVRHGTMKITYKSQMITLDYDVINSGVYYLSSYTKTMVVGNNSSAGYSINNTRNFYSLQPNGVLKYYNFNTANNKWYLYDGKYISSYKYEVVDDKIKIYLVFTNFKYSA